MSARREAIDALIRSGLVIEKLTPRASDPNSCDVRAAGKRLGSMTWDEARQLGLASGTALDDDTADRLKRLVRFDRARRALYRAAASRSLSRAEALTRLRRAGGDDQQCEGVVERLIEIGVIDDRRLADRVIERELARAPAAARLLEMKLRQRGIERAEASQAISEALDGRDEHAEARRLAQARAARMASLPPEVAARRLTAYLARRGFPPGVCVEATKSALESSDR